MKALQIKDFPEYYVTDTGDVYSRNYNRTGRIKKLKVSKNWKGYLYIKLYKDKTTKQERIHRLVAEAFIPNPENKTEVNHKDGNKENNSVYNLEWTTSSENHWHRCNILGKRTNRVKDYTTGLVFSSEKSAALYYDIPVSCMHTLVKRQDNFSTRKKKHSVSNHKLGIISEKEYQDELKRSR